MILLCLGPVVLVLVELELDDPDSAAAVLTAFAIALGKICRLVLIINKP